MSLLEPIAAPPDPAARAGFVACKSEDDIARLLLRPHFPPDREILLLAGFDAYARLVRMERAEGDASGRCVIPPGCWIRLLGRGIARVVMAHNHPSGAPWPSDADRRCTEEATLFLRTLGIELADHLIFVERGHFSFRTAGWI
ncbi:MAG: DNA repair protein RadC [Sphingopyxis sp.]|uniref:JAB domain-containing protein n=1 Tax=Sphingopyxis sp. TaxID=1908224 RepID=UPI003D80DC19